MRAAPVASLLLLAGVVSLPAEAMPVCWGQFSHTYPLPLSLNGADRDVVAEVTHFTSYTLWVSVDGYQQVHVADSNLADCDADGVPLDFDGDYDAGDHGGFFPFGPWANEPTCNYGLSRHHGPNVVVNDLVFANVPFLIGADDLNGPTIYPDPVTGQWVCQTDGSINPCDPWGCGPTDDPDDCLTDANWWVTGHQPYFGSGYNWCGGGGDGGFWVILVEFYAQEFWGSFTTAAPHTAGSITAT